MAVEEFTWSNSASKLDQLSRAVTEHADHEERQEFSNLAAVDNPRTLIRARYAISLVPPLAARPAKAGQTFAERLDVNREELRGTADPTM